MGEAAAGRTAHSGAADADDALPPCPPTPAPASVAIFRALQLGDLLCAVPAFRALRHAWPQARLTLIGLPWAADLVRRLPYLDDFIPFPGFPGLPEQPADGAGLERFLARVRHRRFDLAIQLHGSGTVSNGLLAMFGARRLAGFHPPGQPCPDPAGFIRWPENLPEIRRLLALARHLGAPPRGEALELPLLWEERLAYRELLDLLPQPRYACIHPGARQRSRRWLPERFAAVADRLADAGLPVVLTGAADEAALLAGIRAAMHGPAVDLGGRTSLGSLAAVVAGATLVVCNDTGVSHVAVAMGTASVVISSGADALRWRPLDAARHRYLWHAVACRPCSHAVCPTGHECARGVSVDAVLRTIRSLLNNLGEVRHDAA